VTSCSYIAVISKENAGEIPMETMDKKYVNPISVKETKKTLTAEFSRINIKG